MDKGVPATQAGLSPSVEPASAVSPPDGASIPDAVLRPMASAPKDRPIVAYCLHDSDPYCLDSGALTTYGAHAEGIGRVCDGFHVLEWGGGDSDWDEWAQKSYEIPDWWFRYGSEFEEAAAPIGWLPLPDAQAIETGTAETEGLGPKDESAVPKGNASGKGQP